MKLFLILLYITLATIIVGFKTYIWRALSKLRKRNFETIQSDSVDNSTKLAARIIGGTIIGFVIAIVVTYIITPSISWPIRSLFVILFGIISGFLLGFLYAAKK